MLNYFDKERNTYVFYWVIIIGIIIYLYASTFQWMYERYIAADTYYSHGFLIPFVTGFLIWKKRSALEKCYVDYSWWGLVLIFIALLIHILSNIFYVFFTSGLSIFILIFGVTLFLFGRNITRELLFPLMFLLFMFPIPVSAINMVSFPMKMNVAIVGSKLASHMGVSVFQSGFYIDTSGGTLLIDEPCSGIRSLIAFLALGSILAYLCRTSNKKKLILFAVSIPIALLTNIFRVATLIFVASKYGSRAAAPGSFVHDLSGYAIFIIGAILLFGFGRCFEWKE